MDILSLYMAIFQTQLSRKTLIKMKAYKDI